jgi:hypothetical protein
MNAADHCSGQTEPGVLPRSLSLSLSLSLSHTVESSGSRKQPEKAIGRAQQSIPKMDQCSPADSGTRQALIVGSARGDPTESGRHFAATSGRHQQERGPPPPRDGDPTAHTRTYVTDIGENDILLGRGKASINNVGNQRYRAVVLTRKAEYAACRKRYDKILIAQEVFDEMTRRGARFLEEAAVVDHEITSESTSAGTNVAPTTSILQRKVWIRVNFERVMVKIKQSLRDHEYIRPTKTMACPAKPSPSSPNKAALAVSGKRRKPPPQKRKKKKCHHRRLAASAAASSSKVFNKKRDDTAASSKSTNPPPGVAHSHSGPDEARLRQLQLLQVAEVQNEQLQEHRNTMLLQTHQEQLLQQQMLTRQQEQQQQLDMVLAVLRQQQYEPPVSPFLVDPSTLQQRGLLPFSTMAYHSSRPPNVPLLENITYSSSWPSLRPSSLPAPATMPTLALLQSLGPQVPADPLAELLRNIGTSAVPPGPPLAGQAPPLTTTIAWQRNLEELLRSVGTGAIPPPRLAGPPPPPPTT